MDLPIGGTDKSRRFENPMETGQAGDIVEMVGASAIIRREGNQRHTAGAQYAMNLANGYFGVGDMLEHIVTYHDIEAVVGEGNAVLRAEAERHICRTDMRCIAVGKLYMVLERLYARNALGDLGELHGLAAVSAAKIQNVLTRYKVVQVRKAAVEFVYTRLFKHGLPKPDCGIGLRKLVSCRTKVCADPS